MEEFGPIGKVKSAQPKGTAAAGEATDAENRFPSSRQE